ncbi:putative Ig domain-containing protein [Flavobacterium algicola]|uniref:putative Ig domain-containing protein n=1 Tax=Flavobacterium algicola TaxID=556529 RepID=UPI001EFC94B4|nr:putative Ig domain-containing protein [Flavobacterium algicola]MCG9792334.1 putative Ig domain-containing protein [Flavobacterium algicola]
MNSKQNISYKLDKTLILIITCAFLSIPTVNAQVPDPNQGLRADWMRGALGMLWLPERTFNGNIEGIRINDFLTQIKDIRTVDYVQIPLTSPNIFSPTHVAPHSIIESLWRGDTDANGDPINLVVPRAANDDPFLSWLKALRAAGLKTEVYVNSYNLLARIPEDTQADYPDVSARWMEWCDTNAEAQAFINSQTYHEGAGRRKYMFCYAHFILKEYSERYGDLIDAWCFDSADNIMEEECGDDPASEDIDDQRIYQAFANAVHAGNPNAAVAFNNSVGERLANPFTTATYFDDYTFGHPFGGAGNMVENETLYGYNHHVVEFMQTNSGYAFRDDDRSWNDNVVGHFFPKQSATSWNAGNTPCLTDEQFPEWCATGVINGGAITWGTPLVRTNLENSPTLTLQPYALNQWALTDVYFKKNQSPGKPNWSRQYTSLPTVIPGQEYSYTLVEGVDFWDPEEVGVTSITATGTLPTWLTISKTAEGNWTLSGTPPITETAKYTFKLVATDNDGATSREVALEVIAHPDGFTDSGDGTPVWLSNSMTLNNGTALKDFTSLLKLGVDYYDFEGDALTLSKITGPEWLTLTKAADGTWTISGTPTAADEGLNSFTFKVSDGVLSSNTEIKITVDHVAGFTDLSDGTPVWSSAIINLADGKGSFGYSATLQLGSDYYDFEGDVLTITKLSGPDWLSIQQTNASSYKLSGTPINSDSGTNSFKFELSDGSNSSIAEIRINVIETVISDGNVEIKATSNTNYGINTVATMYSAVQTAPDGLATYRISIDVTPPTDKAIYSGTSGGITTVNSWGIGDGVETTQNTLFRGSDNEWTKSINNIKMVDFNQNGGALTTDDVTMYFKSISIGNSQSVNDFVSLKIGEVISNPGRSANQYETIDLAAATSVSKISDFSVGTGTTSETNKWSVEGIIVAVDFKGNLSTSNPILDNSTSLIVYPNPATDYLLLNYAIHAAQIINMTGKIVKVHAAESKKLDVSNLPTGIYILKGSNEEGKTVIKRFIKN